MNPKQAKDFLVQQAKEQARLDGVSLSELETRMMYFTESDDSCEGPVELNEEFERQYDTEEYEPKMSSLLHHAYKRLKSRDPEKARRWDIAIRTLSGGDHYLLVLWNSNSPLRSSFTPVRDSLPLLGAGLLVAVVLLLAIFFAAKRDISVPRELGMILLLVLAVSVWLLFNWARQAWVQRRPKHDKS